MKKVFISYSSEDLDRVQQLVRELEKAPDIRVWFDQREILPGDDFLEGMTGGIAACDKFIICLSPAFNRKPPLSWARQELRMAMLSEQKSGQRIIIPVRLERGGGVPLELGTRAYADISTPGKWRENLPRLLAAIRK
jgi:hypothetical protein